MKILFVCTGNSCRSQMAEGFARAVARPGVEVYSAGTFPVGLNPRAVEVMAEKGVDISPYRSKPLEAVPANPDVVITLCGDAYERCPAYPGAAHRDHWPLADPGHATGTLEERLTVFRAVRDEIEQRVHALMESLAEEERTA